MLRPIIQASALAFDFTGRLLFPFSVCLFDCLFVCLFVIFVKVVLKSLLSKNYVEISNEFYFNV